MGRKLLVVLGLAGVAAYLFRDRITAGALLLVEKANQASDKVGSALFADDWSEEDDEHDQSSV
jgi:hypothetical protein